MNEDYGRIIPVEGGAEPIDPSLRYRVVFAVTKPIGDGGAPHHDLVRVARFLTLLADARSEEHTSELQSLMRISYAVFCLKKNIFFYIFFSLYFFNYLIFFLIHFSY